MSHGNARLNVRGRLLLIDRVIGQGRPVSHVATELGISRQCAHRWVTRLRREAAAGLQDRSSRPRRSPRRTPAHLEQQVLELRHERQVGPARLSEELGIPTRTISAILRRHEVPRLSECDPLTGVVIRASRRTGLRYERDRPGELVHMDVKKPGRIPDGGGWRAHGRSEEVRGRGIGFDYVHSMIDDHSRLAYSEILPDEKGATCAQFLLRAADYFARHGINRIERILTDNALAYRYSLAAAAAQLGAKQVFIRPHCPWQNGKIECLNRTLQIEWAYRRVFHSNDDRAAALAPWLEHYNTRRIHSTIGGRPISRVSPTRLPSTPRRIRRRPRGGRRTIAGLERGDSLRSPSRPLSVSQSSEVTEALERDSCRYVEI